MGTEWIKFELSGPRYFVEDFIEIMDLLEMTYDSFCIENEIQDYPKLEIDNITTTSFQITLNGLWDGIEKLAELLKIIPELFTPTYWEKKREELERAKLNNELIKIEINKKKVRLIREIIKMSKEIQEEELRPYIIKNLIDISIESKEFKEASEKSLKVNFLGNW